MHNPVDTINSVNLISHTVEPLLSAPLLSGFQLFNLKPSLPTPFKPFSLALLLSDPSLIQPNFYSPQEGWIIEVLLSMCDL